MLPIAHIAAYGLTDADYRSFFNDIGPERLKKYPIEYDPEFIRQYLLKLDVLRNCLERGVFPK